MELTGEIIKIGEIETIGEKGFKKRQLVLQTDEQYPQKISIDFLQDKCVFLDNYKVKDDVTVNINIGGREWTNKEGEVKYFNSIVGWRISKKENDSITQNENNSINEQPLKDELPF